MTLDELITALSAADPRTVVPNGFGHPHSYRGYYVELAFEPQSNVTVADMLDAARSADGSTYEGWKGGDFTMGGHCDCYLAVEGSCGEEITPSLLAVMLAAGEVPDERHDPRAGLWRVLVSVGVTEERAGLWLDAFAAEVRAAALTEAADAEAVLRAVYRERAHLVALLAAQYPSHIGHSDPAAPDWAVVTIEAPSGQLCWHISPADMPLFSHVQPTNRICRGWDGHTTEEKYSRIRELTGSLAATGGEKSDRPASLATACTCGHTLNWHNARSCTVSACSCREFTAR